MLVQKHVYLVPLAANLSALTRATIVFVYKHTVRNPKRYGVACEEIMSDENDRFLTELCKLRARTRSRRFYRERCPGKCNAAK